MNPEYLPLIASICLRYWRRLPLYARTVIDCEDMIEDCCLSLHEAAPSFDPERGSYGVFAAMVAHRRCRQTLAALRAAKRMAETVPLDGFDCADPRAFDRTWLRKLLLLDLEAKASASLRAALKSFQSTRHFTTFTARDLRELRRLVCVCDITADEFAEVLL